MGRPLIRISTHRSPTIKALTYQQFGNADQLQIADAPEPVPPEDGVVVAMQASSLNVIDIRSLKGLMAPFVNGKFPKIPGTDIAGIVTATGSKARKFKIGDRVFGATNAFRGGAFAEYVAVPESALTFVPEFLKVEEAAALPTTGLAALYALRDLGRLKSGNRALIYGSSGAAGLFAIQIAKALGAETTTVSGTAGAAASKALGADDVIDYKSGPVAPRGKFDVIVDFSGNFPFAVARQHLTRAGRFIEASPSIPKFIGSLLANPFRAQKHLMLQTVARTVDLDYLVSLVQQGQLKVTIAKVFPLDQAKQAFLDHERGGIVGKIAITA